MRRGIRDNEVGTTKRHTVDQADRPGNRRSRRHESTVVDHRVLERYEWVEDDWSTAPDARRGEHVEVPWVSDDEHIRIWQ